MTDKSNATLEFLDDVALLVDGDPQALQKHADFLADSDEYRDLRHEVKLLAEKLREVGSDFSFPPDLQYQILKIIDARGPSEPVSGTDESSGEATKAEGTKGRDSERVETLSKSNKAYEPDKRAAEPAFESEATRRQKDDKTDQDEQGAPTRIEPPKVRPQNKPRRAWVFVVTIIAGLVLVVGVLHKKLWKEGRKDDTHLVTPAPVNTLTARISAVHRDSGDTHTLVGSAGQAPLRVDTAYGAGETIRTDRLTRAVVALSDGSTLILNRDSEIALDPHIDRQLEVKYGEVLAEIVDNASAPNVVFSTPIGQVEISGTKFDIRVTPTAVKVGVIRGSVQLKPSGADPIEIEVGQEGVMHREASTRIVPLLELARLVHWSEFDTQAEKEQIRGLGELRATRPGERESKERPLALANHRVTVRIVGSTARTEIEETFKNDSPDTLEGIYRFPLPADARIAELALEVDGTWQKGAFVEREEARKIWRGVIRQATPKQKQKPKEEFIWVPGPWKDPALLEWQRGGRFELRIFPIPGNSERRVRLAYTQTLAPSSSGYLYVYPLPHSTDDSTKVGNFALDLQLSGIRGDSVRVYGYAMRDSTQGENTNLVYETQSFLPSGDLIVEYDLPDSEAEIRWWSYQGSATAPPPKKKRRAHDVDVDREWRALHTDRRGYVAFAIRPDIPAWRDSRLRDYVFILDSSHSVVGERFRRSRELVQRLISEMDRRDRFLLMTCDLGCRQMSSDFLAPAKETDRRVRTWLSEIEPAGASNLIAALRQAKKSIEGKMRLERDVRFIYLGDGMASVGHRRTSSIVAEAETITADPRMTISTIGVGNDVDTVTLAALARAGGGHYIPYIPGQRANEAALTALQTTYGAALKYPTIQMPDGIESVVPQRLPTIRAGQEIVVVARLTKTKVNGNAILSGSIGERSYNRSYPISIKSSQSRGNAFVSNLWAAATIDDLQLSGKGEDLARIIALSKGYGVLSRYTSLLVLESEAMFRAFGIDPTPSYLQWTGEEEAEMEQSDAVDESASELASRGAPSVSRAVKSRKRSEGIARPKAVSKSLATSTPPGEGIADQPAFEEKSEEEIDRESRKPRAVLQEPGRWMRKIWVREASIQKTAQPSSDDLRIVDEAIHALNENPNSRDRYRKLVRILCRIGNLERALSTVNQWIERDRLDPEALIYLSDIVGRRGLRDQALRYLSGIVDLRPDDPVFHRRMANAYERAEMLENACAHRVALAEILPNDISAVSAAVRCERGFSRERQATLLLDALPDVKLKKRVEEMAAQPLEQKDATGVVSLNAVWQGKEDVDLSLITSQGTRLSWMGGRTTVVGSNASEDDKEVLGLQRVSVGGYTIEVSRTRQNASTPINGKIKVEALGTKHTFDFNLTSQRTTVGRIVVRRRARLVPR